MQFQSPFEIEDGAGNYTQGFHAEFEMSANLKFLRGGEAVLAARLEQKAPSLVTIRVCNNARRIGGDWRAVDTRSGAVYHIKETPRPSDNRAFFEFLVMSGVAA